MSQVGMPGPLLLRRCQLAMPSSTKFNVANTSQDWDRSHHLAAEIALDPATPRRQLALALDTYNRHDYSAAEKWAGGVLTAGLAEDQLATARLVLGRS